MLTVAPNEAWIEGYEGLYSIDTHGNVWSHYGVKRKLKLHRSVYIEVSLRKDSIDKRYKVHRLIANAFIPNTNNLPQVNHKDGNKHNNNIENLE